ncbi:hypothetical protein [Leclercia adecarboxylata]|uniref:hypothetical protein n=1 Tax=Leclercia adecarboxylata TaxID=83655 RepID=UPI001117C79B|nr:hypothetical protein [Leclercia adecarboxylata]QCZ26138.1 hypothetical protein FHN83_05540 [Leclercia adecarboxylata]
MGFVSPAGDYVEQRFSPASMCMTNQSRIIETSFGYAIVEPATRVKQGQVLLILSGGRTQFAKFMGKALITDDGEAIEGEAAEEVEVMGRVTYFINSTDVDDIPV